MTSRSAGARAPATTRAEPLLARWGRLIHRRRRLVLALSLLLLVASGFVLAQGASLSNEFPEDTESGRAARLLRDELPGAGAATFSVVFTSDSLSASDPAFREAVEAALSGLRSDPRVSGVLTPYEAPTPEAAAAMVSEDGHDVVAFVSLEDGFEEARAYYPELRETVRSNALAARATGNLAVQHDFDVLLERDLIRAELVSLPLALLFLILVFGTLVAALLPLGVGLLAVAGGVAGVFALSHVTDVSTYAINIVTLIGLGVAIDYSLFIVNRFREELARDDSTEDALARTLATAGRATAFSGLTVAIGLSGMLFFRGSFLASMGLAGAVVVGFAVLYGLTFLPALLAMLGPRVNRWRVPFVPVEDSGERGFWHRLSRGVMRRPVVVLVPTLAILLAAGAPFLDLRLASGDVTMLPPDAESREAYDILLTEFPGQDQTRISVVAVFPGGDPLSEERVGALHDLSREIAAMPDVLRVESVVDGDPNLTREQYQALYAEPRGSLPPGMQAAVRESVGESVVVFTVLTAKPAASDEARELVADIRERDAVADGEVLVTGQTAFDVDTIAFIVDRMPEAAAFVVLVTYALILVQVRSVLIPLKAVLMNLLSITASFGALVYVFQQGHFSDIMGFTPASIDPTLPVILFSIVFGLSMDYEVLLLSRMHEEYERSGDNERAVAEGLAKSGRLITGAAAIMVAVFAAFALADVVIIKAVGFGLALAIAVDATLVRALVVPATMRLMGDLNWWAPGWLGAWGRDSTTEEK